MPLSVGHCQAKLTHSIDTTLNKSVDKNFSLRRIFNFTSIFTYFQRPHLSGIMPFVSFAADQNPFSVFHNSITEILFVAWAVSTFLKIFGLTIVIFSSTTSEQKSRVKQSQESQWQNPTLEETTIFSFPFDFLGMAPPAILLRLATM